VLPGNEGRDYVLRRVIRRAVQQGVAIGVKEPFLAALCERVVDQMGVAYPALVQQRQAIKSVASEEEQRFRRTLDTGLHILNEALRRARDAGTELPAEIAFELHDTYGFPFDLTREIAQDEGMSVDEERFEHLMAEQRERARTAQRGGEWGAGPSDVDLFQRDAAGIASEFVGYEKLEVFTVVRALRALEDGRILLKLAESPFYAEGGGQVADEGWIHTDGGKLTVVDVVKFGDDQVVVARVEEGSVANGERAKAMVNAVRRHQTACNHTATHLLHNALRLLVDDSIRQAGSMVRPEKLRFDFTTRRAPTGDELRQVEELVNRRIVENHPVRAFLTTREYAAELGALAFFEEKYGETVRVLEIDELSRELCGGTHVSATSQIGLCKITASQSVGANARRIEAVTSAKAIEYYRGLEQTLGETATVLKTDAERVPAAVRRLNEQVAELKQALRSGGGSGGLLDELVAAAEPIAGARLVVARVDGLSGDDMLQLCDALRERLGEAAIILAAVKDANVAVLVALSDGLVGRGLHAQEILRAVTAPLGGKGGGRPTLARGGVGNVAAVEEALAAGRGQVLAALGA
jgi:alanyl-tRNA synthetase